MSKRVIECNICGEPLAAANDEELVRALHGHIQAEHEGSPMDEDQVRETVAAEAYEAGDS